MPNPTCQVENFFRFRVLTRCQSGTTTKRQSDTVLQDDSKLCEAVFLQNGQTAMHLTVIAVVLQLGGD